MKKLFISQPMSDKTNEEIENKRLIVKSKLENEIGEEIQVIDSFFKSAPINAKPLWFLGKSIQLLSDADFVYFADDWEKYRGCRIENMCAKEYGLKIYYEE